LAARLGQLLGIPHDAEVVAVGSLLHDLGVTNSFTGHNLFEIEGADAARAFAREQGLDDHRVQSIRPESTYDNFAPDFGERFVPGYKPPSSVDYLMSAPFDE
jgi:hypothetical protein